MDQQSSASRNFALVGVAGYIAPKHLAAIRETKCKLIAAMDPHDSVGILDRYFPNTKFFNEIERFDRFLERQRREDPANKIDFLSICTPNYLHDAHIRLALRLQANAICEKPLVINPWNLDQLVELEQEYQKRVYTVLQLRHNPKIVELKKSLEAADHQTRPHVCLSYVTRRGAWYQTSWKGSDEKSGGLSVNIGIHFFDLLLWLFGSVRRASVHCSTASRMAGSLELENARVTWFLSIDGKDLPDHVREKGGFAFRSLTMDGEDIELSDGFTDLHTAVYDSILDGRGDGIADARPSIELVHSIRHSKVSSIDDLAHPFIQGKALA